MKVITLQSGSNGNCIYVEAGGQRLLVDAGVSATTVRDRLAAHGRDPQQLDALLISHDHADHARCMGVYQRQFGVPIYVTEKTLKAAHDSCRLGTLDELRLFVSGEPITIGDLTIETIRTPHDSVDGVVFVLDDGTRRLGVLTDLGHIFTGLRQLVASLDAVLLESNYDPQLLANGPYPQFLKERIAGRGGHLSNYEAAELLRDNCGRLQWACLAHLSEQNNDPDLALDTHRRIVGRQLPLLVASRYEASGVLEL